MKGLQEVSGLRDIKSLHLVGGRSIPKVQRSSYLELYMLKREKDRLEKEVVSLDKRRWAALRHLDSITKRIGKIEKETPQERIAKIRERIPPKPLKTMAIKY